MPYTTYRFDGKVVIKGDVFDVSFPINKDTLFKLDIFQEKGLMSWDDIEKEIAEIWLNYAPDYPRLTGRNDEGGGLRAIEPSTPYAVLMDDMMRLVRPFIRDGQKWIDLCCGRGRTIDYMLKVNERISVIAVDRFSILAPHLCNDKRVEYRDSDAVACLRSITENSIDGVVSNMGWVYAMSHTDENGNVFIGKAAALRHLKKICAVLKPDAPFVYSSPKRNVNFTKVLIAGQPYLWKFWRWIPEKNFRPWSGFLVLGHAKKLARIGKAGLFHFYSPEEFGELLVEAGFKNVTHSYSFAGQDLVFSAQKK